VDNPEGPSNHTQPNWSPCLARWMGSRPVIDGPVNAAALQAVWAPYTADGDA